MLDSRDRLRDSDEDAEKHVRKRVNATTRADRRSVREFSRKLEKSQSKDSSGGKVKHKEIEVKTKSVANAMTMNIQGEVENEGGLWCMMLLDTSQNHQEMTEDT